MFSLLFPTFERFTENKAYCNQVGYENIKRRISVSALRLRRVNIAASSNRSTRDALVYFFGLLDRITSVNEKRNEVSFFVSSTDTATITTFVYVSFFL